MTIKKKRIKMGKTLREVAEGVGSKPNTISQYENGQREPNHEMLKKLATYYNCTIDELFND